MSEIEKYKKKLLTAFKLNGFTIRSDLCTVILEQLKPKSDIELEKLIDKLIESIQKQSLQQANIEKEQVELAIKDCLRSGLSETETILNVINAFEIPKFTYNLDRKKFVQNETKYKSLKLFADPIMKAQLFKDRYTVLWQRTIRHEMFTPDVLGASAGDGLKYQLRTIEVLLSSAANIQNAIVLGMLTQLGIGKFYLEDPTGIVQLDLSEAQFHVGFYTENCFILAEGNFEDKIFHVNGIGFPPVESSKTSRVYYGTANSFGGNSRTLLKYSENLLKIEKENDDGIMVFVADVWLDNLKVVEKLEVLFQGYDSNPPIAFILMGNFLSSELESQHPHKLKSLFKRLATMITQYQNLIKKSTFIFVPGKNDPISFGILPRPPLTEFVTEDLKKAIPNVAFATNPCRIQYCTQEIVVVREDLVMKMARNTIKYQETGEIEDHFTKTILCQGTLSPLTLHLQPIYWDFDHALSLYPLPDLVVVADQSKTFTTEYMDCQVFSPGSFPKNEFSFKVYIPATKEVDDSCIPDS